MKIVLVASLKAGSMSPQLYYKHGCEDIETEPSRLVLYNKGQPTLWSAGLRGPIVEWIAIRHFLTLHIA